MTRRSILTVVFWMTGALLSFSATAVAVRALAPTFSVFEMLTFRSATGVVFLLGLAAFRPHLFPQMRTNRIGLHVVRNVVHVTGTYSWTLGVTLLPLATVFALEFTTPAWVALLAILFLGEVMTRSRLAAVILGFVGVLVILRPGLESLRPASLIVLGSAVSFALTAICTKKLTATDTTYTILFWMNLIQLPLNFAGAGSHFWLKLEASHALAVAALCVGALLSHFCLTNAYRNGDATMVVPLDFLRIPLIAFVGWQLYGEALDPFVFLGSFCIIAGILWNLRAEAKPRT